MLLSRSVTALATSSIFVRTARNGLLLGGVAFSASLLSNVTLWSLSRKQSQWEQESE
jgi:hypothetical protein